MEITLLKETKGRLLDLMRIYHVSTAGEMIRLLINRDWENREDDRLRQELQNKRSQEKIK